MRPSGLRHRLPWSLTTILAAGAILIGLVIAGLLWESRNNHRVVKWVEVPQLPDKLMLYDSVFWEPLDTQSLRDLLGDQPAFVAGKRVLEIGTGSGLIALCCQHFGASQVVATDINPHAIACAQANSTRLGLPIETRLVPSRPPWDDSPETDTGAFVVVGADERFDLIISNPPWENAIPKQWSDFALYDSDFALLRSILNGARKHLLPGGRLILIYGCVEAIEVTQRLAAEMDFEVVILDERDPTSLPDVFLPGMMIGLIPKSQRVETQPQTN